MNNKLLVMKTHEISISLSIILILPLIALKAYGQNLTDIEADSTKLYIVELVDKTTLIGKISKKDSVTISIQTGIFNVDVPIKNVISFEEVSSSNFKNGVHWFPNPNSTRYFFTTSAYTFKVGEGYYQNMGTLNSFNFGITDNISLLAGVEFFSLSMGDPILLLSPKVGFPLGKKVNVAVGVLFIRVPGTILGVVYGVNTFGNHDHNISVGLGWGFVRDDFSKKPVLNIAGMTRWGVRFLL